MSASVLFFIFLFFFLKERRREFEANLEKAGLELETEDKSVSFWTEVHKYHLEVNE